MNSLTPLMNTETNFWKKKNFSKAHRTVSRTIKAETRVLFSFWMLSRWVRHHAFPNYCLDGTAMIRWFCMMKNTLKIVWKQRLAFRIVCSILNDTRAVDRSLPLSSYGWEHGATKMLQHRIPAGLEKIVGIPITTDAATADSSHRDHFLQPVEWKSNEDLAILRLHTFYFLKNLTAFDMLIY